MPPICFSFLFCLFVRAKHLPSNKVRWFLLHLSTGTITAICRGLCPLFCLVMIISSSVVSNENFCWAIIVGVSKLSQKKTLSFKGTRSIQQQGLASLWTYVMHVHQLSSEAETSQPATRQMKTSTKWLVAHYVAGSFPMCNGTTLDRPQPHTHRSRRHSVGTGGGHVWSEARQQQGRRRTTED